MTLTLTDFLLARIAEDEAEPRSAEGLRMPEMPPVGSWGPLRVLAECEAKRRIVEMAEGYDFYPTDPILAALALPYADHPEFQQEWAVS